MRFARIPLYSLIFAAGLSLPVHAETASTPQQFLETWGKTWDAHDVDGMMRLHAEDCVTVNRFGVVATGRDEIRRSLTWLHNGPFHDAHFGVPKLLDQRRLGPGVIAVHASWQSPSGRPSPAVDNLVVTFVLREFPGDGWLAEEIDTHLVDPLAPTTTPTPEKP